MSLKYALIENHLTDDPNDFCAKPMQVVSHDLNDLIIRMLNRGSTTTEPDIYAVLTEFFTVVSGIIADGESVNLPIFNTNPSIKGVFNGPLDGFDKARHSIRCNITNGKDLKQAVQEINVTKVSASENKPHILEVTDNASGPI